MIERTWGTDGIIRYNCSGTIHLRDLVSELRDTVQDSRYAATTASLWDLRGGKYPFGHEAHDNAAPLFRALLGNPDTLRKVAWIVEYETSSAIIDIYFKSHTWPQEWRTFHNYEEAEAWCKSGEEALA